MKPEPIVFDSTMSYCQIQLYHEQGIEILCPVCGAALVIVDTLEMVVKHQEISGAFCPSDKAHVYIQLSSHPDPSFWSQFSKEPLQDGDPSP